jgi:hypothetical protein
VATDEIVLVVHDGQEDPRLRQGAEAVAALAIVSPPYSAKRDKVGCRRQPTPNTGIQLISSPMPPVRKT